MTPRRAHRRWLTRLLNATGLAIAIAAVIWVGLSLQRYAGEIDFASFDSTFWALMSVLAFAYGASSLMLARAWWQTLLGLEVDATWRESLRMYGISQLGKYIPGNVAQVIGRQVMAQGAGYDGIAVGKSAVMEVVLLCMGGIAIALVAGPSVFDAWPGWAGGALAIFVAALLYYLAGSIGGPRLGPALQKAYAWIILFLVLSSLSFGVILYSVESLSVGILPIVIGAYAAAWLIGYVAPGAPAGIGIREVALAWLLGDWVTPAVLALTVVLGRVVTVVGDLVFCAIALALGESAEAPTAP